MDMDDNFIPTSWIALTSAKRTRQIDDGTLNVAIAVQRGAHPIKLLLEDNDSPWGTQKRRLLLQGSASV